MYVLRCIASAWITKVIWPTCRAQANGGSASDPEGAVQAGEAVAAATERAAEAVQST